MATPDERNGARPSPTRNDSHRQQGRVEEADVRNREVQRSVCGQLCAARASAYIDNDKWLKCT